MQEPTAAAAGEAKETGEPEEPAALIEIPQTEPDPRAAEMLWRVKRNAVGAYLLFAVLVAIWGNFRGFVGLTCSALVTIISFLWLEEIVNTILQPAPQNHSRRLMLRTLARFALLGVSLSVAIFVARFNTLTVLLGFSIVVVGIMGEALHAAVERFAG
jgi:hypothetical protein